MIHHIIIDDSDYGRKKKATKNNDDAILTALTGALKSLSAPEPVQQVPKKQRVANDENRYLDYCTGFAAELAELPRHKAMEIRMKMEQMIYAAWTEVAASEAAAEKRAKESVSRSKYYSEITEWPKSSRKVDDRIWRDSGDHDSDGRNRDPDLSNPELGSWDNDSDEWIPARDDWCQTPEDRNQTPEDWNQPPDKLNETTDDWTQIPEDWY